MRRKMISMEVGLRNCADTVRENEGRFVKKLIFRLKLLIFNSYIFATGVLRPVLL